MLVEPADHWAARALNGGGAVPPTSRPPTAKAPRPQARPAATPPSAQPKVCKSRPSSQARPGTAGNPKTRGHGKGYEWYSEIGVEDWERRAAVRIGVVLPEAEAAPRPRTAAVTAAAEPDVAAGSYPGLTTERLWAMHTRGSQTKPDAGAAALAGGGTPRPQTAAPQRPRREEAGGRSSDGHRHTDRREGGRSSGGYGWSRTNLTDQASSGRWAQTATLSTPQRPARPEVRTEARGEAGISDSQRHAVRATTTQPKPGLEPDPKA